MNKKIVPYILIGFFCGACGNDDEGRDMEKPSIEMSGSHAFPQNCTVLRKGESYTFKAIFTDNRELGNYNIEIHNNFDHHSHSTDNTDCDPEPKKAPVNPFVYNQDFPIPEGVTYFEAQNQLAIPPDIDAGDYHFMIRLTDKAGWQQLKSVSLKISDRD
jgi:hypothetical protein